MYHPNLLESSIQVDFALPIHRTSGTPTAYPLLYREVVRKTCPYPIAPQLTFELVSGESTIGMTLLSSHHESKMTDLNSQMN